MGRTDRGERGNTMVSFSVDIMIEHTYTPKPHNQDSDVGLPISTWTLTFGSRMARFIFCYCLSLSHEKFFR